jgi:hypothetical protein
MAKKPKSKSAASTASSWWAERSKILASITKPARARPKPKKIKTKKVTKAKMVMKVKKANKAKKVKKSKKA